MRRTAEWLLVLMLLVGAGTADGRTVAYWQFDGAADGLDAVADDDTYCDMAIVVGDPCDWTLEAGDPANSVPNPSWAPWRAAAGDGDPNMNTMAQRLPGYGGAQHGWWRDPYVGTGDFQYENDANEVITVDSALQWRNDQSFTAECYLMSFYTGYVMGNRTALSFPDNFRGWQLWITTGGQKIRWYGEGASTPRTEDLSTRHAVEIVADWTKSEWHHVAVVWDHDAGATGTVYLYIDGEEAGSAAGDPDWSGMVGGPWMVGIRKIWFFDGFPQYGFINNYETNGVIDEMRFVDEALTPEYFLNGTTPYVVCGVEPKLPGDLNGDCTVGILDLGVLAMEWLMPDACSNDLAADIDGDCAVNVGDLAALGGHWLDCVWPGCP